MWSQVVTYDTIIEIKEIKKGVFDTLLYVKKHVEIKEEVVIVDTLRGYQWAFDFYAGTNSSNSRARYKEIDLTYNSSNITGSFIGSSLYYNFSKLWSVRVGAKFEYQKITANYIKSDTYNVDVSEEVDDTLDTYYTLNGPDTNFFHITETRIIQSVEEKTEFSDLSYSWEVYYLRVPIQGSYSLKRDSWNFSLLAGTSLNLLLKQLEINSLENQENIISFFPSGIISFQAGYFITNSSVVHIEPFFEKSFINGENSVVPDNQFSIGIGLKHFF